MKAFLVLSFLILLLADEALCSSREQRLSKLLEKLEAKVLSSPTKPPLIQPRKAKHNKKRVKENTPTSLLLLCMSSFLFVVLIFYTCQCSGLNVLQNGRVFNPIAYGADPTGTKDSSDAILQALGDAFQLRSGLELLPGISDFGGVVIDLQGGNYKISKPIRFPSSGGGNIVVSLSLSQPACECFCCLSNCV